MKGFLLFPDPLLGHISRRSRVGMPCRAAVFLLAISQALSAQVTVVNDLLESFESAQREDCYECQIRRPATAGGVRQDALFEHPPANDQRSRITFPLDLPSLESGESLMLGFDIAISDGIKPGPDVDGVRFDVEVDGALLFSAVTQERRWQPCGVPLTPWAGQRVALSLLTHAGASASYDWALWGNPRLLRFHGKPQVWDDTTPGVTLPFSAGAVAVRGRPGTVLRWRPLGQQTTTTWTMVTNTASASQGMPTGPAANHWLVADLQADDARGIQLETDRPSQIQEIRLAHFPPRPALAHAGAATPVLTADRNIPVAVKLVNEGRGRLDFGAAQLTVRAGPDLVTQTDVPPLKPGESWTGLWDWRTPSRPGPCLLNAELSWAGQTSSIQSQVTIQPAPTAVQTVESDRIKLEFIGSPEGYAGARLHARQASGWVQVGVWSPLFRLVTETESGWADWTVAPAEFAVGAGPNGSQLIELSGRARDADGVPWQVRLQLTLPAHSWEVRMRYTWQADRRRRIRSLWGPNLYPGEGTIGPAKSWGLFPGVEYLFGAEPSSNERDFAPRLADRRTPHPHWATIPLMALTLGPESQAPPMLPGPFFTPDSLKDQLLLPAHGSGPGAAVFEKPVTVALSWNPLQRWDGQRAFPSARFASPNFDETMLNHRLGLFLASFPELVPEHATQAATPVEMPPHRPWQLEATLWVTPGPVLGMLGEWVRRQGGLPTPTSWPRSFSEELDLCRTGLLETVWVEDQQRWQSCVGWPAVHAPGFAALLWLDAQITDNPAGRAAALARVEQAVQAMLQEAGPALLMSQGACHIMQWEFPFYYGHLPEAMAGLDGFVAGLIRSQQPEGGWVYQPANADQAGLGQAGDSVLGTCANRAATLLRYARLTGNAKAREAGEKALRFMESFRLPRGGQTWECPMYEPDILAAAYAIRAYHDAYRITGDPWWLHQAVYWAETGLPFVYLWSLPDKPMMLGATIPVFGSTFYHHSWLGMPVQWCGLVYAYHVYHLARELEEAEPLVPLDGAPALALGFKAADWLRVVELITASALHQQVPAGPQAGCYPDSISDFEKPNPPFLSPEDILVNVLALRGHDPDLNTLRLPNARDETVVSSAARISQLREQNGVLQFQLQFFPGQISHTLVTGPAPQRVEVDGQILSTSAAPLRREPGWWWDPDRRRLYLAIPHRADSVEVTVH